VSDFGGHGGWPGWECSKEGRNFYFGTGTYDRTWILTYSIVGSKPDISEIQT